jgi:hypothetical protein
LFLRKTSLLGIVLIMFCLIFMQSCETVQNPEPEGTLVSYGSCKNNGSGSFSSEGLASVDSGQECIEYSYVGGVLRIKHINAAFNCCLEKIAGNVSFEGEVIRIESEGILDNGGCHCLCLYDVEYEIYDLTPGTYILVAPTFTNSMEIDIEGSPSGLFCEPRNSYPWD